VVALALTVTIAAEPHLPVKSVPGIARRMRPHRQVVG
jgi:hypothetical protein